MQKILIAALLLFIAHPVIAGDPDTSKASASVLVIPYMPMMHLSDADQDISEGSDMAIPDMRAAFRAGLIKSLNQRFAEVYNARIPLQDFVAQNDKDMELIYHSLLFEQDSVWPVKFPKKFAVRDTTAKGSKVKAKIADENKTYINVGIADGQLLNDLSKQYEADYFIFLNEFDIKTHFDDCLNLALKIYQRELRVHYTIFDRHGKQVYGDVAVAHFPSNSNNVNEIMENNFPVISDYVMNSMNRVIGR